MLETSCDDKDAEQIDQGAAAYSCLAPLRSGTTLGLAWESSSPRCMATCGMIDRVGDISFTHVPTKF